MRIFGEVEFEAERSERQVSEALARTRENLASVKAIVAIASARGGVGKSTIAVNVAAALTLNRRKVGIVDADLNSPSIVAMLGMKPNKRFAASEAMEPGAGPMGLRVAASNLLADGEPPPVSFLDEEAPPAATNGRGPVELSYTGTLRRILQQTHFGSLDLLLIDLAPGLEQLHRISKIVSLTGVVIVSQPSELSVRAIRSVLEIAEHTSTAVIGIVENMVGFNCGGCHAVRPLMPQGDLASVAREAGASILARLPFDPRLAEACDHGVMFVKEFPDTPLAKQLAALAQSLDVSHASPSTATSAV